MAGSFKTVRPSNIITKHTDIFTTTTTAMHANMCSSTAPGIKLISITTIALSMSMRKTLRLNEAEHVRYC